MGLKRRDRQAQANSIVDQGGKRFFKRTLTGVCQAGPRASRSLLMDPLQSTLQSTLKSTLLSTLLSTLASNSLGWGKRLLCGARF